MLAGYLPPNYQPLKDVLRQRRFGLNHDLAFLGSYGSFRQHRTN
jgi:hypothetical protein